jgi:hypothetical protein
MYLNAGRRFAPCRSGFKAGGFFAREYYYPFPKYNIQLPRPGSPMSTDFALVGCAYAGGGDISPLGSAKALSPKGVS